jgi:hypothetical protein
LSNAAHVFQRAHTSAHGEWNEHLACHGFDVVEDHVAAVAGGGNVEEYEFVGALLVVAGGDFDRVAQFDKVDDLDHTLTSQASVQP